MVQVGVFGFGMNNLILARRFIKLNDVRFTMIDPDNSVI
jgi:hypothetical protein